MSNVLTGIKPTGLPHIGNYLGAIKPAIDLSKNGSVADEFFYFIADYHSLTGIKSRDTFQEVVYQVAATWLACGLDPKRVVFYKQSDIPEIFELAWILSCHIPKGDLNRAHAYKAAVTENSEKGKDLDSGINMGLYSYPVLMAADILLFDTNIVPVGQDQVQHVEITRSIAQRINQSYGDILVLPQEMIRKEAGAVVGLDGRKMSKSYNNSIPLFESEKGLKKLVNRITTDSTPPEAPKNPDSSLLYSYYSLFATPPDLACFRDQLLKGISWGEAKAQLFELINGELKIYRDNYSKIIADKSFIDSCLRDGALKAREIADKRLKKIRAAIIGG